MTYIGLEAGVDVKKEFRFSNYKEFDKVMLPTKEIEQHDGRKRNEWTISSYRFPEKIDPKEFEEGKGVPAVAALKRLRARKSA